MALAITTITNNIAAISVSGVTIKDMDELKESVAGRDCPILYPKPDGFVTNFEVTRDSFGSAAQSKKTVQYTLNYRFLYIPVGAGRGLFDVYDDMVTKAYLILDAIMANDDLGNTVEFEPAGVINFGPVGDPAGALFHGCDIAVRVMEFVN